MRFPRKSTHTCSEAHAKGRRAPLGYDGGHSRSSMCHPKPMFEEEKTKTKPDEPPHGPGIRKIIYIYMNKKMDGFGRLRVKVFRPSGSIVAKKRYSSSTAILF